MLRRLSIRNGHYSGVGIHFLVETEVGGLNRVEWVSLFLLHRRTPSNIDALYP